MNKTLILGVILFLIAIPVHAQILQGIMNSSGSAASFTPAVVNFRGMPSTETTPLGTKANGTCATDSYCTQLVDPTLAGNGIIVFYTYKAASGNTANIPTVFDCTTYGCTASLDTFTHCGTDGNDSTTDIYVGCFYTLTATTGARNITVRWTAAVSQVSVSAASFYNVTAFGVYATNSGAATTTFTSGSATSTSDKDLWFQFACATAATMPTNVGAWTLGSQAGITWHGELLDRRDACAIQSGVQTVAGALNPQITTATSNRFVALGVAFKSGSSGTAPSGMYIRHLYTNNSAVASGTNVFQLPVAGNLVVGMNISGARYTTAVSDSTNGSWLSCGPPNINKNADTSTSTFYFPSSATGVLPITATTTGTGDVGPMILADVVGAASTQICARTSTAGNISATGASFTAVTNSVPSSSAGIVFYGMAQAFNTSVGITSPTTNFDLNTVGAQSLSGPSIPDQNNGGAHFSNSSNTPGNVTWTQSSSSQAIDDEATEIAGFQAPAATLYPMAVGGAGHVDDSTTTAVITGYTPFQASDLFAVIACTAATTGTITITDSLSQTYTTVDGPTNNTVRCKTAYTASASGSTVTITATFGTANAFTSIMMKEFANVTTLDGTNHNLVTKTGAASGLITGTATGTLGTANSIAFEAFLCNNTCDLQTNVLAAGVNLAPWTIDVNDGGGNIAGYLATGATTAVTSRGWDVTGSASETSAIMVFH